MNEEKDALAAAASSTKFGKQEGRHCKNVCVNATKEDLAMRHKVKMEAKRRVRDYYHNRFSGNQYITANIGRNHPDYGMTVSQHQAEKMKRLVEKNS